MAAPDERCAASSQARDEPMLATASRVVRWLVVEQPGPWGHEAVVESRLDEATGRVLQSAGRRHGFRTLLARRPGWGEAGEAQRVYLARTRRDGGWIVQLDLEDPRQLQSLPWDVLDQPTPPELGVPGPAAVHLVCTNGKHDPCCADRGRPVVRALAEAGTPEVWESSHVGGDRFAANLVSLPSGVYFGRVEPEEAAGILEDLGRGRIRLDRYRGRSCYSALAQSAEIFARQELAEDRLSALSLGPAQPRPDGLAVSVERDGARYEVVVSRHRAPATSLSCGAAPSTPWRYQLESFTAVG